MGLLLFLKNCCFGEVAGISFVDSTALEVCHPKRKHSHKVFKGLADWGKSSMGWYFGFKLHLIINDRGELLSFALTEGNVDERKPLPETPSQSIQLSGQFIGGVDCLFLSS
jgi:hypothetical protein